MADHGWIGFQGLTGQTIACKHTHTHIHTPYLQAGVGGVYRL